MPFYLIRFQSSSQHALYKAGSCGTFFYFSMLMQLSKDPLLKKRLGDARRGIAAFQAVKHVCMIKDNLHLESKQEDGLGNQLLINETLKTWKRWGCK